MRSVRVPFFACLLLSCVAVAQETRSCLTDQVFQEAVKNDPAYLQRRQALEEFTRNYVPDKNKTTAGPKIIPVVFHVIHQNGPENISKAQIQDAVRILNEDFRRTNADAINTPSAFISDAADCNIEFRLAQLDPNGKCTEGIVRVYSPLTNNAYENVKSLSDWPSNKYLNIWVVKTIDNSGSSGTILGFAHYPGVSASLDGVVVRHDYTGSIGSATSNSFKGRTLTHEVGHWLNLIHIWGDANCGNDQVFDTPTQQTSNSGCPAFPHVTCSNGPDGDMFPNYMDYTDGDCQNLFSNGQSTRMDAALTSSTGGRNNLWSGANLIATGTDGTPATLCAPIAYFTSNSQSVCKGNTVKFYDVSWNGTTTGWSWAFEGGSPAVSTDQNPVVQYNTVGTYSVTYTANNTTGSNMVIKSAWITVYPDTATYPVPFSEGFESATYPNSDWVILSGDNTNTWQKTATAKYSGTASLMIKDYGSGSNPVGMKDSLLGPPINFSTTTASQLSFRVAFAKKVSTNTDKLTVSVSTDCGQTWLLRYSKSSTPLSTAPDQPNSSFVPNVSQWRLENVDISTADLMPCVRLKFEFTSGAGNNIYIDDINITGSSTIGIPESPGAIGNIGIFPNPATGQASLMLTVFRKENISVELTDVTGRIIQHLFDGPVMEGRHDVVITPTVGAGLYFIRVHTPERTITQKLIVTGQ